MWRNNSHDPCMCNLLFEKAVPKRALKISEITKVSELQENEPEKMQMQHKINSPGVNARFFG